MQVGQVFGAHRGDPVFGSLAGACGQDPGEAAHMLGGGRQCRAPGEDGVEGGSIIVGELLGPVHDPPGDLPNGRRRGWRDADTGEAQRAYVVADELVATAVTQLPEFAVQLRGVSVSFGPALCQVGLVRVELAGTWLAAAGQQLFGALRVGCTQHGVLPQVQDPGDLPDSATLVEELVHGGVPFAQPLFDRRDLRGGLISARF